MNKPDSLREHLTRAIPELRKNPDRLLVFIDNGTMRSTAAPGLSFEYSYTLNLIFTDFAAHPDSIAVPLFAWLLDNQRELMENPARAKESVQFEADILDNKKVDLSITLPLTERVIVKQQADGTLQATHPPEPQIDQPFEARRWQTTDAAGNVLAEWDSPAP
ncbi:P2 phage tail completion protein R (GpR) [Halopseudomonas litoralis]|uniref:p2 phage tail completion protein R (GpR) n=1 Tax=Halopseudomonas litoralis TaxID=797277 RepID=A0A1H1SQE9_9GAMM|nr:phage tail protein [Halopseudomonas litoralis]SDS49946.1 P2 phage tail completion protein R (GpR) [Halopseudomonas litoralis]